MLSRNSILFYQFMPENLLGLAANFGLSFLPEILISKITGHNGHLSSCAYFCHRHVTLYMCYGKDCWQKYSQLAEIDRFRSVRQFLH